MLCNPNEYNHPMLAKNRPAVDVHRPGGNRRTPVDRPLYAIKRSRLLKHRAKVNQRDWLKAERKRR